MGRPTILNGSAEFCEDGVICRGVLELLECQGGCVVNVSTLEFHGTALSV